MIPNLTVILNITVVCYITMGGTDGFSFTSFTKDIICDTQSRLVKQCTIKKPEVHRTHTHCAYECLQDSECIGVSLSDGSACLHHFTCAGHFTCGVGVDMSVYYREHTISTEESDATEAPASQTTTVVESAAEPELTLTTTTNETPTTTTAVNLLTTTTPPTTKTTATTRPTTTTPPTTTIATTQPTTTTPPTTTTKTTATTRPTTTTPPTTTIATTQPTTTTSPTTKTTATTRPTTTTHPTTTTTVTTPTTTTTTTATTTRSTTTVRTVKTCQNKGFWNGTDWRCVCSNGWVGDTCERRARGCQDIADYGYKRGWPPHWVYIDVEGFNSPLYVRCQLTQTYYTLYTMINQGRIKSHNKTWSDYENGYTLDNYTYHYWIGLKAMKKLNDIGHRTVCLETTFIYPDSLTTILQYRYDDFRFDTASKGYTFTFSQATASKSGNYSDKVQHRNCLDSLRGQRFSTWDTDDDGDPRNNCAAESGVGWWYKGCAMDCNPLGLSYEAFPSTAETKWHIKMAGLDYKNGVYAKQVAATMYFLADLT